MQEAVLEDSKTASNTKCKPHCVSGLISLRLIPDDGTKNSQFLMRSMLHDELLAHRSLCRL